ncbi:MAG: glycosyltransferase family 39 protein [Candidatus Omnitrophica bacterium]|nr:glycosyltransferase family 39 protein [Candidatus Omnitrophota bacterium]
MFKHTGIMDKKHIIIFVAIFLLGAFLRVGYFHLNGDNVDSGGYVESWSRIYTALNWIYSDIPVPDMNYGILHSYIISTGWFLSRENIVVFSRLVSLFFGILFLWLFYALLKEFFGVRVALGSLFLLSLYPLHIQMSSASLAGVPAYFLLFSSLYFLKRYDTSKSNVYIILAALALMLSCMLRYECWMFIFFFSLVLFLKYRLSFSVRLFFGLSCMFPVFLLFLQYKHRGNPFGFIQSSATVSLLTTQDFTFFERMTGFIQVLCEVVSLPVFIVCAWGYIVCLFKRSKWDLFLFLFTAVIMIYTVRSLQGYYLYNDLRYSLIVGLLFLPFGGFGIDHIRKLLGRRQKLKFFVLMIAVVLGVTFSVRTLTVFYARSELPDSLKQGVAWLKNNVSAPDTILLEDGNYCPFISVYAHIYPHQLTPYDNTDLRQGKSNHLRSVLDSDYIVIWKPEGYFRREIKKLMPFRLFSKVYDNKDLEIFHQNNKRRKGNIQ